MTMTVAMYGAPSLPGITPPAYPMPGEQPDLDPWIGTPAKQQPLTDRQAEAVKRMLEAQGKDTKRLIRVVVWDDGGKLNLKISVDGVVISESETDGNSLAVETKL